MNLRSLFRGLLLSVVESGMVDEWFSTKRNRQRERAATDLPRGLDKQIRKCSFAMDRIEQSN